MIFCSESHGPMILFWPKVLDAPTNLCEVPNGRHSARIDGGVILVFSREKLHEPCNAGGIFRYNTVSSECCAPWQCVGQAVRSCRNHIHVRANGEVSQISLVPSSFSEEICNSCAKVIFFEDVHRDTAAVFLTKSCRPAAKEWHQRLIIMASDEVWSSISGSHLAAIISMMPWELCQGSSTNLPCVPSKCVAFFLSLDFSCRPIGAFRSR